MKIRTGFVTNSSSSSYICVLGEITNKELFEASGLGKCYFGSQLKGYVPEWSAPFYELGADWAGVYIDEDSLEDEKEYFFWEEYGGAGDDDYSFWQEEGDYMDYDVTLDDFPPEERSMFDCAIPGNGLTLIDRGYGAGRNG